MDTAWSRWLVGAWAILATIWLFVAILMLVQTWPLAPGDDSKYFRKTHEEYAFGPTIKGNACIQTASAIKEHFTKFLLFALVPPGFLFVLVCAALWVAGLPFPIFRLGSRGKLPNSK